ncbi:MAG: UDP-N-acetylmuramate:L-alanyl-gamma-D-glutamyl-meso-diaminopimelate ligase [Pseudobdellovibrio sp.]
MKSSIKNVTPNAHIHMMGICGTAMASLAGLLKDRGFKVTGSDSNPYPPMSTQLEAMGIIIQCPYRKENLNVRPDFVIVGNVISANNEEALEMNRLELPYCSLPEAMGELIIADKNSFVVSGTHGKTTTTSLLSWVAENCGAKPGFIIGGIPKNFSQSFRNPKSNTFIIEGDEYDTAYFDKVPKFIHYKPQQVILTSVEFDHADIYKDFDAVKAAFKRLALLIPEKGSLVYWGDDSNVTGIAKIAKAKNIFSYGFAKTNDYCAEVVQQKDGFTEFKVSFKNEELGLFRTIMTGNYNILNATAVVAQAHIQGWDFGSVQKAMSTFTGVKRRQEILGEPNGILIMEDFAHHPTAVKETVKGIQARYKGRKVFSVFEPRSATSRRKVFQKDYADAFQIADEIILAEAFDQAKITESDRFSVGELIADLHKVGKTANSFHTADQIVAFLKSKAKTGDVILIMSNGGFDGIYQKLMTALA